MCMQKFCQENSNNLVGIRPSVSNNTTKQDGSKGDEEKVTQIT